MDVSARRDDVPVLRDSDLVYLDAACMGLKPAPVIDAVDRYHRDLPACAGRSTHRLGNRITDAVADARERIGGFFGVEPAGVVFTRNTTEAINLVAHSLAPDVVVTSDREHNSNLVPWQRHAAEHRVVPSRGERFDMDAFREQADGADLVSVVHVSNLDGYALPVEEIVDVAHDAGARVLLDAAQSAPHRPIDLAELGVDMAAVSGHKMGGPSGTGALLVRGDVADELEPFLVGGETVTDTTYQDATYAEMPDRLEAGLQDYGGILGFAAACDYLAGMGVANVHDHEKELTAQLRERVRAVDGVEQLGVTDGAACGIANITVAGMDPHEVALLLDRTADVAVRAGRHCLHSWYNENGVEASVRASLGWYNTAEDVNAFGDALQRVVEVR